MPEVSKSLDDIATPAIDDALYSRQRYVLGDAAMQRMANSNVLVVGAGGLGIEIAKNLVLAGIKSLALQDHRVATYSDLGTQFFLRNDDVVQGRNRAEASRHRLAELNPYVSVEVSTNTFNGEKDWSFLRHFQCVVLTEVPWNEQIDVDTFCRQQDPVIKVVTGDVRGVFTYIFCDFGCNFEVIDSNGEEVQQTFVCNITKGNPGVVTTFDARPHGLEDDELVAFKEVGGMEKLNDMTVRVKVVSPYQFTICDTSGSEFCKYTGGGIAVQVKELHSINFNALSTEFCKPSLSTPDLAKCSAPSTIHLGFCALQEFETRFRRLPGAWDKEDCSAFLAIAKDLQIQLQVPAAFDEEVLKYFSFTAAGCFAPLCAVTGGMAAQEVLKAVTGKFSPLLQWFHLDAVEIIAGIELSSSFTCDPRGDRYDSLRTCVGDFLCQQMARLKVFMVGCGAIGCEMLKNFALLGVGSEGQITITDHDLIEKSNLNRQFLFRPHHIQQSKSATAAAAILKINPNLKIVAQQHKVWSETENTVHTDTFLQQMDLIVSALDNVEARRYVDQRCIDTQRPLLESGTTGMKGHTQVIVPHLTESYGSQRDPVDEDIPFCSLKSFPAKAEHCMIWAKSKFESSFAEKPSLFNKFWSENGGLHSVIKKLAGGEDIGDAWRPLHLLQVRAADWLGCVHLARLKFEKYFNHKAKSLLYVFPLDHKRDDGSPFWLLPRRPPHPVDFDSNNELHMLFITSAARLYADVFGITPTEQELHIEVVKTMVKAAKVPPFIPGRAKVVADEDAKKEDMNAHSNNESPAELRQYLEAAAANAASLNGFIQMTSLAFEKDDDSNGHLNYIAACTNLRATMYSIEQNDRYTIKKIVGKIIPAIATTTAVVSGLVSIEMLKVIKKVPLSSYKNCFLNLALPVIVLSEPGVAKRTTLSNGMSFTLWDKWVIRGSERLTVAQLLEKIKAEYNLDVDMIVHGAKMVYSSLMPAHRKKLTQTVNALVKKPQDKNYVDLTACVGNDSDLEAPPIRYYFS